MERRLAAILAADVVFEEEDVFADGMAEDVIRELSMFVWPFVNTRNSDFT